jgi:hypothetical protein
MKRPAPSVQRRDFPRDTELAQWRAELGEWGFTLKQGKVGYWYSEAEAGFPIFYDRMARRAYVLALAWIMSTMEYGQELAAQIEAARHERGEAAPGE